MKSILVGLICLSILMSCSKTVESDQSSPAATVKFTVEAAPEWTALFKRSHGWFGGDGIFAIPFSGQDRGTAAASDSILFVFSDTMVGDIEDGKLQPGYKMINNSVMVLHGNKPIEADADFLVNYSSTGEPRTLFVPRSAAAAEGDYLWLGDGFVNKAGDQKLYLFAYRIRNTGTTADFPFREVGNTLIIIPKGSNYPFEDHQQKDLTFSNFEDTGHTSFGVGILDNTASAGVPSPDGFIYIYGVRGSAKQLVAARVKPESVDDFSTWSFWNGQNWSPDFGTCVPLTDSVSNELSVTPIGDNQFALIYQYGGIFPTINMQVGPTPVGPFGPRLEVWETTDHLESKDLFSYNAKAHPAISKPGELLVSYNVNSFKFFEVIEALPNLYRPRFVRIVFDKK